MLALPPLSVQNYFFNFFIRSRVLFSVAKQRVHENNQDLVETKARDFFNETSELFEVFMLIVTEVGRLTFIF